MIAGEVAKRQPPQAVLALLAIAIENVSARKRDPDPTPTHVFAEPYDSRHRDSPRLGAEQ
jgi:hypothetical protein